MLNSTGKHTLFFGKGFMLVLPGVIVNPKGQSFVVETLGTEDSLTGITSSTSMTDQTLGLIQRTWNIFVGAATKWSTNG